MGDHNRTTEAQDNFKEKRKPRGEIKFNVHLNEEQKEAKRLIIESEIVIITGRAGSGKTLTAAQTALDLLFKQEVEKIYVTRPTQQMGDSLGFLPGTLDQKLDPYLDPFKDNLYQCYDRAKIDKSMEEGRFEGFAIQFARGKTIKQGKILVCDESQNTTKHQMLGLLTRLGKGGRIIIIGDNEQKDIRDEYNGLSYAIELSKRIPEIKWIKLKENHRSDVVGKILDYEYNPRF
jgi:phosphate starvation-inducible PhoH-like protein